MAHLDRDTGPKLLLSPKSVKYLVWSVKMCTWVKSVPYQYDPQTKKFIFDDSRRTRIIWWFHNILLNIYIAYVWVRWIQNALISVSSPGAMGSLYVALNYQCCNAVQISLLTCYGSHQKWLNMLFEYLGDIQESQGNNLRTSPSVSNDCGPLLRTFFITSFLIFCLDNLSLYGAPFQPFFISSLHPEPEKMTFWDILPFGLLHDCIWVFQWTSMLFYYSSLICYLTGIENALESLRCTVVLEKAERMNSGQIQGQGQIEGQMQGQSQNNRSRLVSPAESKVVDMLVVLKQADENEDAISTLEPVDDFAIPQEMETPKNMQMQIQRSTWFQNELIGQNPMEFAKQYRTMEILQNFCNKIWGTCNACYEVSFIIGSVLGYYNAVTMEGGRAFQQFAAGLFFTYTLMMIWQHMGSIFEQSSDVLLSWQVAKAERPWFRKFMKSSRPIRTHIGGFFYADRGIRLTILAIIFDRTTSLLLSD